MGRGSQGKNFFRTKRKLLAKRRKWGESGPAYTPPFKERFKPKAKYGGMGDDTLSRKHLGYITPENTKTKKGPIPKIVNEEDIPSYLWNHCLKMKKLGMEQDYCRNECPLGEDCEGSPGNINYPVEYTVKGFRALYKDKKVKLSPTGLIV